MTGNFHPNSPELLAGNAAFARDFDGAGMPAAPARRLAVVACMDARIDVPRILGLHAGEAHIIRNAGGVVTDDVIRSLCLSQRLLGTREVVLVHHTSCGLQSLDEQRILSELEAETGIRPSWPLEAFEDPYDNVAESMRRLRSSPFLPHKDHIRGFVYDVADGKLHEVGAPAS